MLKIKRIPQTDCTIGILNYRSFRCFTLELPYKDNQPNISCIPNGLYRAYKVNSPNFGMCIAIEGVLGRTYIRIHSGNFVHQIEGCILVGENVIDLDRNGIPDVTNSVSTLEALMVILPSEFRVHIS